MPHVTLGALDFNSTPPFDLYSVMHYELLMFQRCRITPFVAQEESERKNVADTMDQHDWQGSA